MKAVILPIICFSLTGCWFTDYLKSDDFRNSAARIGQAAAEVAVAEILAAQERAEQEGGSK
jgi:hypothetical protein